MPICRPCSSTTLRFMNKCGLSMSNLKSARLTSRLVMSRTFFSKTSVKDPVPKTSGAPNCSANLDAESGKGTNRDLGFCGRLLSKASILSFNKPGTNHSQRSSLTWFKTNKGTVTVTPSRASPGSCKYVALQSVPPKRMVLGKAWVVMPAASWRINSSRVNCSSCGCCFTS